MWVSKPNVAFSFQCSLATSNVFNTGIFIKVNHLTNHSPQGPPGRGFTNLGIKPTISALPGPRSFTNMGIKPNNLALALPGPRILQKGIQTPRSFVPELSCKLKATYALSICANELIPEPQCSSQSLTCYLTNPTLYLSFKVFSGRDFPKGIKPQLALYRSLPKAQSQLTCYQFFFLAIKAILSRPLGRSNHRVSNPVPTHKLLGRYIFQGVSNPRLAYFIPELIYSPKLIQLSNSALYLSFKVFSGRDIS